MKTLKWRTNRGIKKIEYDIVKSIKLDISKLQEVWPEIWKILYSEYDLITTLKSEEGLREFLQQCDDERYLKNQEILRTVMRSGNRRTNRKHTRISYSLTEKQSKLLPLAIQIYNEIEQYKEISPVP